jgi:hypothetical protein
MLLLAIRGTATCRLLDQAGAIIGTVVQPASEPVVGRGAGTVLLTR